MKKFLNAEDLQHNSRSGSLRTVTRGVKQWLDEQFPEIAKRTRPVNGRVDDIYAFNNAYQYASPILIAR
jgi:hypothetical protein